MIELAQDLTFLGFRCAFRDVDFDFSDLSTTFSSSIIGDESGDSKEAERAGSDALLGREGMVLSPRRDSNRKNPLRFARSWGDGGMAVVSEEVGETADTGRLRLKTSPPKPPDLCLAMSRMAPAVLGRPSFSMVVLREGRPRADAGLEVPALMIEDRLPVAEWPRMVESDVSVSDEMVDNGRIYSTLSEKPTRALEGGRRGELFGSSGKKPVSRNDGWETDLLTEWPKMNWSPSSGVTGALPARG